MSELTALYQSKSFFMHMPYQFLHFKCHFGWLNSNHVSLSVSGSSRFPMVFNLAFLVFFHNNALSVYH